MIKKILLNILIFFIALFVATILTLPKENLWFKMEELAFKKEVIFSDEILSSNPVFLNIENLTLSVAGMEALKFEKAQVLPLLFFNTIEISNLNVGKDLQQFKEIAIEKLVVTYSVFQPIKIFLDGEGEFGTLKGRVNVLENTIDILLFPSEKLKKVNEIMKHFKKLENGGYVYNAKF
jgi:hypothetical protein